MIERGPFTFRSMPTDSGHLVIRTEASGYELVWEVAASRPKAAARCKFWRAVEAGQVHP